MKIRYLVVEADIKLRPFDNAIYFEYAEDAQKNAANLATRYQCAYEVHAVILDGTATPQVATFRPAVTLDEPA